MFLFLFYLTRFQKRDTLKMNTFSEDAMKKLCISLFLCALLSLFAFAAEPFGYYDTNLDGKVELSDTFSLLRAYLNDPDSDVRLLRVLHTLQAVGGGDAVTATVAAVDTAAGTVTLTTPYTEPITAPFSALGIGADTDIAALDSKPLVLTLSRPFSAQSKIYAACLGARLPVAAEANDRPLSIKSLNKVSTEGSHTEDDFLTASMESSYRETVVLSKETTGYARFDYAWYPRVKQLREDLYILFFMRGQVGPHLYWSLSEDGVTWDNPSVLYSGNTAFTHTDGPLEGTEDYLYGCNADAVVLENGDILCVYYVRPSHGYDENYAPYWDMNGIYLVRGRLNENDKVVWGTPKKIYTGPGWEPYIWQRADGVLEIYWSGTAPYMTKYGYDTTIRSAGVLMIQSYDGGETWTPDVQAGDTNYYQALHPFGQYIGDRVHPLRPELGKLPYFGGQMPTVCRLVNGKTLLAAEVRSLELKFTIATDVSDAGGVWKNLAMDEATPNSSLSDNFSGVSPYLIRFPSGEVLLNYARGTSYYYRMMDAEGQTYEPTENDIFANDKGIWGSSEMITGHEVINANQKRINDENGDLVVSNLILNHSYLNHRTNAQKYAMLTDGYTDDWANNTDALFIGSESQAQLAVQTAHDKDNVYFLLSRMDTMLTSGDNVILHIDGDCVVTVALDGSYTVGNVSGKGVAKVHGTIGDNTDTDEGVLIELAIPKTALGLTNATSFALAPILTNVDDGDAITDTLTHADLDTTARWPVVVLD